VRAVLIGAAKKSGVTLYAVSSTDIEGTPKVELSAVLAIAGPADAHLENIVSRLGLEPDVSAVSWKAVQLDPAEQPPVPEI
jgi:putative Mg2+ transporter-C (MgtC) family protein